VIDFDSISEWFPSLEKALCECVSALAKRTIVQATPRYVEDARALPFTLADRDEVIDATLEWIRASSIAGYHGTRLNDVEVASVRSKGLVTLKAENRRERLRRALSAHADWPEVAGRLDEAIRAHGQGNRAGRREDQVHLTLSKRGLTDGFNHYLTHGAEFDQHVAHAMLGAGGEELLRQDGQPTLIIVAVPGASALDAAHPHFTVDDLRRRDEVPNLVRQFLEAWSYRLAHADFQCRTLEVDCGMVFRTAVPRDWIVNIETLPA
jgi:hypothetical protein